MSNSKTEAWARLSSITGYGQQGLSYIHATTISINNRINFVEEQKREQEEYARQRRGRIMYERSIAQKIKDDAELKQSLNSKSPNGNLTIKLKLFSKQTPQRKKINEDKCAICHDKFDIKNYNDILTLDCNHTYHHSCIRNMLFVYMDDKCPLCRKVFEYKFDACRKTRERLKNKILKHYRNECNRIELVKIMELALFLSEKGINFRWLIDFISGISHLPSDAFVEMRFCEIENDHIYLFQQEFCAGDRSYKEHCSCGCDVNLNHCNH